MHRHLLRWQCIGQNVTKGTYTGAGAAFGIKRMRTSNKPDLRLVACN